MRSVLWGLGLVMAVVAAGCMDATLYSDDFGDSAARPADDAFGGFDEVPYGDQELPIREARLAGRIGSVRGLGSNEALARAWWDGGRSVYEVHGQGDGGAAMFALYVMPDLAVANLELGQRYLLSDSDVMLGDATITMVGCAGVVDGRWEYDEPPSSVIVSATDLDGDGAVELAFEATFGTGRTASSAVARFELAEP